MTWENWLETATEIPNKTDSENWLRKKERKKISLFGRVGTQHITRTVITKKRKQKKNIKKDNNIENIEITK